MIKSKHKLFFDFAKEEQWLSDMSENGYELISIDGFGKYTFHMVECIRNNYRIDYRTFKSENDFQDYCSIFEDSGWKHRWGTKNSGSQYFVQSKADAPNDIFSDAASKAGRYKRFYSMWLSLLASFIPIFVALIMTNQYKLSAFTNPQALYFTPGLWDMEGIRFWRAFLFETPFAFGRGFMWVLMLAILVFYFIAFLKAFVLYRHYLNKL